MRVSIIVAMTPNLVIGKEGGLPWHLRSDLIRFREFTKGHALIMGRSTFASLPRKNGDILPGRELLVLTRENPRVTDGTRAKAFPNLESALEVAKEHEEVFVIGGASVYRETLPHAARFLVTTVYGKVAGDTFFPEEWRARAVREDTKDKAKLTLIRGRYNCKDDHDTSFKIYYPA